MKTPKVNINITSTYLPEESIPDDEQFVFSYHVTIHNASKQKLKLLTRHWIITDGRGEVQEVHGEGVVGEQPEITAGKTFEYTSYAIIKTEVGFMQGVYDMTNTKKDTFEIPIPVFTLATPHTLH